MQNTNKAAFVYTHKGGLYVNLTNRCTNDCSFCVRKTKDGVGDNHLWLQKEPTADEVVAALDTYAGFDEVVFCGYGEPTMRLDALKTVAKHAHAKGMRVRVNTNGQGNLNNNGNILPGLVGTVDAFSISLNAADAAGYQARCHCQYGHMAYSAVCAFCKASVKNGFTTTLTVLSNIPQGEIDACAAYAKQIGANFRVRSKA